MAARTVEYSRIDAAEARELFIRHALVEGDWAGSDPSLQHNAELIEEILRLEVRARRPLFVGDEALVAFYNARLGESVVSARTFDRWSLRRVSGTAARGSKQHSRSSSTRPPPSPDPTTFPIAGCRGRSSWR